AAYPAEKQRRQIDRRENPDAGDKGEKAAEREIAALQRAQVDDRLRVGQAAPDEGEAGDRCDPRRRADRVVAEPIPAWSLLERVFEAAEKERHQRDAGIIGAAQQR